MIRKTVFKKLVQDNNDPYLNEVLTNVNDHVVKLSVMTGPFPWHFHPNSDETFIGLEGTVLIETKDGDYKLTPGSSITIARDTVHRTSPEGEKSVNLTVEKADIETIFLENPSEC